MGACLLTSFIATGTPRLWAQLVDRTEPNSTARNPAEPNPATVQPQPASTRIKLVNQPVQSSEARENMLDNHNRFACNMYPQLGKEPGNLFFSPSSIWTALVLTNAVYFKGSWLRPFNADSTQAADFRLTAAESIPVPMMHQLGEFAYNSVDGVQVLELPYGDRRLSMLILLPTEVEGLAKLEAQLTIDNLQRWTQPGFRSQKVKVYLPKFKSTSQFELKAVLAANHLH